jgi:hypothetical protein
LFTSFLLVTFADLLKKSQAIEDSSFGSSAIFPKRPAAFRPLLTEGLALSGFRDTYILRKLQFLCQHKPAQEECQKPVTSSISYRFSDRSL